jgi:oligopeptide transport system substrate-binding protein
VVARDKATLVVTLKSPFADFPSTVANTSLAPVPRGLLSTAGKARRYHNAPVGNGPFMLAGPWDRKSTISLVSSPGYAGTKPHIAGITFTAVKDPAAAYAQFKAGTLDVAAFPAASLAEVEAAYGTSVDGFAASTGHQVVVGPRAGVMWSVFNTRKAPLDDVRVRRAFSLALDRTKLSATIAPATELLSPASDMLSPGVPGYAPGRWLYAKLDQAQAAALLAEAGYPGGAGLPEITFLTTDQASKAEYKTGLAAVGVKVRFVEVSQAQFLPKWLTGKYMMCQEGWNTASPTAGEALFNLFYSRRNLSDSFYDDPAVDAALLQACATLDDAARVAAFQSIDATIGAAAPVTPVAYFEHATVCSARLQGAVLSPMSLFDFTGVWIQ